jgi:putative ABC transport system permease protein
MDLRYAFRVLLRRPGFTTIAVITIALGIGPTTAVFSLINGVLLSPSPYKEPDRLVMVWRGNPERGWREFPMSVPDFLDYKERNEVFDGITAFTMGRLSLTGDAEPEVLGGSRVSADIFSTVGVEPLVGRGFKPGEDQPGANRVVVLSQDLWGRRFASDPGAIGKTMILDGQPHTIVGVMPAGREFPPKAQLWVPLTLDPQQGNRGANFLTVLARLKTGVTAEQAQAQMNIVSEQLEQQYPQTNAGSRIDLVPLEQHAVRNVKTPLLVLFGAIGLVLLIACANVANLLLVRAAGRQKEFAVRTALGANRRQLVRQLVAESAILSFAGGAVGLLLATWMRDLLVSLSPLKVSRIYDDSFDLRVIVFTFLTAFVTGIIFGLVPALRLANREIGEALKESTGRASAGMDGRRLRGGIVVAEVALSFVLLIGAGLLMRSFLNLSYLDPGFNPQGVLTFNVSLSPARYAEPPKRADFISQITERLQSIPGATAVASAGYVPLEDMRTTRRFALEGEPLPEPGREPLALDIPVSPDYFKLLGIPVRSGRAFTPQDNQQSPGEVIINESFARRHFPGQTAVGRHLLYYSARPQDPPPPPVEIVGVVADLRQANLAAEPEPIMYRPHLQRAWSFMTLMVRADGDPTRLAGAVKEAVRSLDPEQPISNIATLDRVLAGSISDRRGLMLLVGVFAALALVLAAIGIYGVISYAVSQRTHEIGIRLALGAQTRDVLRLVVRQGLTFTLIGIAIGIGAAFALARVISGMLFDVNPTDPLTFAAIALLLAGVALAACYIPARRATKVDPMVALKYE